MMKRTLLVYHKVDDVDKIEWVLHKTLPLQGVPGGRSLQLVCPPLQTGSLQSETDCCLKCVKRMKDEEIMKQILATLAQFSTVMLAPSWQVKVATLWTSPVARLPSTPLPA